MTDIPTPAPSEDPPAEAGPLHGPPLEVDCGEVAAWFDAGMQVLWAADRRRGWLYGRTALLLATDALAHSYRVARAFGWTSELLRRGHLADSCLDAVVLRLRADLPGYRPDLLSGREGLSGWAEALLDSLDLRLQRLQVPVRRRAGAVVLPRSPRTPAWGPDGRACLRVTVSPMRGWRLALDGVPGPPARVVAGVDRHGVDEVAALAVAVLGGAFRHVFPGPASPRPRPNDEER